VIGSPCHLHEDAHGGHSLHDSFYHRPFVYFEDLTGRFDVAFYHGSLQRKEYKREEEMGREGKREEEMETEGKRD
jgi:hypothetical protein